MSRRETPDQPRPAPATPWRQANGLLRSWRYDALLEEGRRAWAAGDAPDAAEPAAPERTSVLWRFEASAEPWRLRMTAVERTGVDDGREEIRVDGTRWWARSRGRAHSGDAREGQSIGTDGLATMLRPPDVVELLGLRPTARPARTGGRALIEYAGALPDPGADLPRWEDASFELGDLVVLGSDGYRLTVDADTGVVVAWQASVGGHPARGAELRDLRLT
ncbi:hypothetical protein [Kitasatospora sp. NPDC097643]|uniref:hypothetical protein n=1 Tax=Kitasatospora sp. NPDC097643 TaxID=3157230 RepID=UPI0033197F6C